MDGKQFVTVDELEKINGTELIGTDKIMGYMHGYLIESKLYYKLKALAEPFDYKEYRKERIAKKLEEKTAERITIRKKLPKVNKKFVNEMTKEENSKKAIILEDDRFGDMFVDKNFEINQDSEDFLRLNRKKMDDLNENDYDDIESEENDLPIVPKLKKKRKIEKDLVEEPDDDGGNKVFKDRIEHPQREKKEFNRKREKKSKYLKEKPDLEGRRTVVPMQKLLRNSPKNNFRQNN